MKHICTALVILISINLPAQDKTQAYFDTLHQHQLFHGNILLAQQGKVVYRYSGGYANERAHQPNQTQTRFNLASISKVFTSTAILQLRDKGKLQLEDDVRLYFPDFPFPGVRIRHLLTHTAGLPNLELTGDVVKQYPDTVITNAVLMQLLKQWGKPLYFTPGEEYRYCNTGYMLLATIVEKQSRMPFAAYLDKYIFKPAGMKNTYLAVYGSPSWQDTARAVHQVMPFLFDSVYTPVDEIKRYRFSEYNNQAAYGSSNIISTVEDILKFDAAFFGYKLLRASSVAEAITPFRLNNGKLVREQMDTMLGEGDGYYGLGWEIFEQPGFGKGVGHGGYKFGMATFYYRNLDKQQVIVSFMNGNSRLGDVVTSGLYLLNGLPAIKPDIKRSAVRAYAQALISKGPDHAAAMLQLYRADSSHYYFSDKEMNFLGYDFLYQASFTGHQQLSLETFKLNTFIVPGDFNVYDSYGEALMESGNKEDAVHMYKRSLELNPQNQGGIKALERIGSMPGA